MGAAGAVATGARERGAEAAPTRPRFAFVGTSGGDSAAGGVLGIGRFAVDAASGALSPLGTTASDNPSFLALHPRLPVLYAVNEVADGDAAGSGWVAAYAIDRATGGLTAIGRQASAGAGPAHLAVDAAGGHLVVANYGGATFALLPIAADGRLEAASDVVRQTGSGPNRDRQGEPHPHGVAFDPGGRFVATADLGIDQVAIFAIDRGAGRLRPVAEAATAPGAGPRHVAFHPNGTFLYAINELDATIAGFPFDPASGAIGPAIAAVPTLPAAAAAESTTAELAFHPSGRFLFGSNRSQPEATAPLADSIVGFAVDPDDGRLSLIGHAAEGISVPRHFALDPSGAWLYACNQGGDSIVQFAIDAATGELRGTGRSVATPAPACLVFAGG